MRKLNYIYFLFCFTLIGLLTSCPDNEQTSNTKKTILIGSGSPNAVYYPIAQSICEIFNKYNKNPDLFCQAKESGGAQFNLSQIEKGKFDMGISQASLQYDAYHGIGNFEGNPHKNLRSLFLLHNEYLSILAKKDSSINSFADLKGKKINIGNEGSGSKIIFTSTIEKIGWSLKDFSRVYQKFGSDKSVLCDKNKADASVYLVGHPNKSFHYILKNCDTKLIQLSDKEIEMFVNSRPEYLRVGFIENAYSLEKIKSPFSPTILSVSSKLDQKIINNFTKILKDHKEELIKLQPSLKDIFSGGEKNYKLAPVIL